MENDYSKFEEAIKFLHSQMFCEIIWEKPDFPKIEKLILMLLNAGLVGGLYDLLTPLEYRADHYSDSVSIICKLKDLKTGHIDTMSFQYSGMVDHARATLDAMKARGECPKIPSVEEAIDFIRNVVMKQKIPNVRKHPIDKLIEYNRAIDALYGHRDRKVLQNIQRCIGLDRWYEAVDLMWKIV